MDRNSTDHDFIMEALDVYRRDLLEAINRERSEEGRMELHAMAAKARRIRERFKAGISLEVELDKGAGRAGLVDLLGIGLGVTGTKIKPGRWTVTLTHNK